MSYKVHCEQCNAIVINQVPCHEHGCPNSNQSWVIDTIQGRNYAVPENEASEPNLDYEIPPTNCYDYEDNFYQ